ncbi:hypothetical protein [Rhodospira trueperi]|uniref:Uncharacterized protein n=1 Tax=Rhodospira trueperi TaxID=69960 RepID=A0A1G7H5H4_9PROT|nr:hypothetical protein [Rhodospira trueperi]SDE95605.1 hypothetical protein SAMN05421720_1188 [Rhodospira trueperi]
MSGRRFPDQFSIASMAGPRARDFADSKPEDAFQTLVNDWLLTVDPRAKAVPTTGPDGRIDGYAISLPEDPPPLLSGAAAPLIVECKWHDGASSNVAANVRAGWANVAETLKRQAAAGWPGLYEPWRTAQGYLYCLSVTLPNAQARNSLRDQIQTFFNGLPAAQRPPLTWIEVVDWPNLSKAFDRDALLADHWLGPEIDGIQPHDGFLAGRTGFRQYLTEDRLQFVAPESTAPVHPDRLLETLTRHANDRGVLLVGPGGVGKTRTAVEVGNRAVAVGWRVLHVTTGRAQLTAQSLADAALPGSETRPVLLVLDYLEQMDLDAADLRESVLAPAKARGGRVALLALARPGRASERQSLWGGVFDRLDLGIDDARADQIVARILSTVAPGACAALGREVVQEAVGHRPIIALLIAREIERRLETMAVADLSVLVGRLRPGDLADWLETRLREDRLLPDPAERTRGVLPRSVPLEPDLVATACLLAATPLQRSRLVRAGQAILERLGEGDVSELLIRHLLDLGWLETSGDLVTVAHDVVTDEVLRRCLVDPVGHRIRAEVLSPILSAGLTQVRVLGRHAQALGRAFAEASEETQADLSARLETWFDEYAEDLSRALLSEGADTVSFALGGMIRIPVVRASLASRWATLVAPWLDRHGTLVEARHVLGQALKGATETELPALVRSARHWLDSNGSTHEANHVLAPLLARAPVETAGSSDIINLAMTWLGETSRGRSPEAQFVLNPLLLRSDLGERASEAIVAAFAWLGEEAQCRSPEARFVLHPLLSRSDLDGRASEAIDAAFAWLNHADQGRSPEARFVLNPLLERVPPQTMEAERAIDAAFAWLNHADQGLSSEARFVLNPLLSRSDLGGRASEAIASAFDWLNHADQGRSPEAQFVLNPLLERVPPQTMEAERAIDAAFAWLNHADQGRSPEASHVLAPLLSRSDLGGRASEAIASAFDWLKHADQGRSPEASHVLRPLLSRSDLDGRASEAINAAFAWLKHADQGRSPEASHVLPPLLSRSDLDGRASEAIDAAFVWLDDSTNAVSVDAGFVLPPLLTQPDLTKRRKSKATSLGVEWLREEGNAVSWDASFVFKAFMRLGREIDDDTAMQTDRRAAAWTQVHWLSDDAEFIINRVLRRPFLTDGDWRRVATTAMWRLVKHLGKEPLSAINALLTHPHHFSRPAVRRLLRRASRLPDSNGNTGAGVLFSPHTQSLAAVFLFECAAGNRPLPGSIIRKLLRHISRRPPEDSITTDDHILAALLPLAHRTGEADLIRNAEGEVRRRLKPPKKVEEGKWRGGSAPVSLQLLNLNAWATPEEGLAVLVRLGVIEC